MTRVLALADHSKIGCITQRRFAKVGTKTHPQRGAALDRNGLSVSTETACRFEPKSPVGNSEICNPSCIPAHRAPEMAGDAHPAESRQVVGIEFHDARRASEAASLDRENASSHRVSHEG